MLLLLHAAASGQEPKPQSTASPPAAGGAKTIDPSFRMIRSVSGGQVIEDRGRYVVEDPRSVFYVPADKQIVVYFTWEGPTGAHHFEGLWKNPNRKVVMISDFDYTPDQTRFSGYFRMLLGDDPATGFWECEARIDGESVGSHSFQIVAASRTDKPLPASRALTPSDIYKQVSAATVFVENLNLKGERRSVGSGFFIGQNRLLTAFQAIDGASKVRIVTPAGERLEAQDVIAWNRRQDWIILRVTANRDVSLSPALPESWTIGDRCFVLDAPAEGNRVLVETTLIGKQTVSGGGDRLNIADTLSRRTLGSPLLNEKAEVIGFIGGNLIPRSAFLEDQVLTVSNLGSTSRGTLAVPMNLVSNSNPAKAPTTIDALARSGQFTAPLVGNDDVLNGRLSRDLNRKTDPPQPIEERSEFSRRDTRAVLLITWLPKQKRKGVPSLRLYDLDNRLLSESPGKKKISVNPQKLSYSAWDLNLGNLAAGTYRIDVLLDADAVWRTFFRIVD